MKHEILERSELKNEPMDGHAYHQIIQDSSGTPVDCLFLDVNPAFEAITGLSKADVIGKTAREVLSGIEEASSDWMKSYEQTALGGKTHLFEYYADSLDRWYEVSSYGGTSGCLDTVFRDITEAKRARNDCVTSETRFRRLFESAKDGILIVDAESGQIMNVNPFLVELLGYSEKEIIGKTIWEIGTFKDVIANYENFLDLKKNEYIRYDDMPLQAADGRQISVEFVSNVYPEGLHLVIQCNIRDITERKRTEVFQILSADILALLNEPRDFSGLIQSIVHRMKAKTDLDAIGVRVHSGEDFSYYAQQGFPEDSTPAADALNPGVYDGDICRDAHGMIRQECPCALVLAGKVDATKACFTAGGSFWTNDAPSLFNDETSMGQHVRQHSPCIHKEYRSIALIPIRNGSQIVGLLQLDDRRTGQFNHEAIIALEEIARYIGVGMVRMQMEENLYASEQKLSSVLNNITNVVWSLSLPDMGVFYVSPSVEKLYGRPVADFVNSPALWQESVHPDDQGLAEKALKQLFAEGYAERECRIVRPDGSIVWIHDKSQLIYDDDHRPLRIEGIASDITQRKQAELSLKERVAELETIYTLSSTLRVADTLNELLTLLLGETLKLFQTSAGAISYFDPVKGSLGFTAAEGWFRKLDDDFLQQENGIAQQVFATKKVLVSKEYAEDPRVKSRKNIPKGWGGVCLPLQTDAYAVGTLFISVELPREISPEEIKLLTAMTEMVGTTIHRIALYEKSIRHLRQVQALRNIDMAISGSMDLRITFRVILDEVTRLLNVDAAAILRLDPYTGVLKYEAWRGFEKADPAKCSVNIGEGLAGQAAMGRRSIQLTSPEEIASDPVQGALMEMEGAQIYCAVPLINKGQVEGVLEIFHRGSLSADIEWLEFLETLAGQAAIAIDNAGLVQNLANSNIKLIQAYDKTIQGWAYALDLRDKNTENHSQRVSEMTVQIGRAMGLREEELANVRRGALLHDIGKMGVADEILLKPGPLSEAEWAIMHQHPRFAYELLAPIEYLHTALDIPYCHHEKWDGTGYPRGLKKEEIPLAARIFAVVDVYDAITSDRPYRKAWDVEKAVDHIRQESGKHFDPQVVEMFFKEVLGYNDTSKK